MIADAPREEAEVVGGPSQLSTAQLASYGFNVNRRREEVVIYYRKPKGFRAGKESRWITFADSNVFKKEAYRDRGWEPLPQYGRVLGLDPNGEPDKEYVWVPLLSTRNGRAELPPDQVLTYRWHDPMKLPYPLRGTVLDFPQLDAARDAGLEAEEYECEECEYSCWDPVALAAHMRNVHQYDRTDIYAIGERRNIDFHKSARKSLSTAVRAAKAQPVEGPGAELMHMMMAELKALREEMATIKAGGPVPVVAAVLDEPVAEEPKVKAKRVQTPEQAAKSRAALAKAREAREAKKAAQAPVAETSEPVAPVFEPLESESE